MHGTCHCPRREQRTMTTLSARGHVRNAELEFPITEVRYPRGAVLSGTSLMLAVYDSPLIKQGFFPWARVYLMHVLLLSLSPAASQSRSHLQHLLLPVSHLHPASAVLVVCHRLCQ
jgi:hypothetical protein